MVTINIVIRVASVYINIIFYKIIWRLKNKSIEQFYCENVNIKYYATMFLRNGYQLIQIWHIILHKN